jgi:hypothetical protein
LRCAIWQPLPQYFTALQALHVSSLASNSSDLPQLAHDVGAFSVAIVADDGKDFEVFLSFPSCLPLPVLQT